MNETQSSRPDADGFGRAGSRLFGAALAGLGAIGVIHGDFALQWQPVPDDLASRALIATISGGVLALAGAGLFFQRSFQPAAWALAVMLFVWTALLVLPRALAAPLIVGKWNGFAEILALASAAFLLAAVSKRGALGDRIALICFGASPLVFGTTHFVYADITATFIPAWIPERLFWAYFTGSAHIAAGAAILVGVQSRLAAIMLGTMYASWVLILHAPRVAANPTSRLEWTMMAVAASLSGAAWIVAGRLSRKSTPEG